MKYLLDWWLNDGIWHLSDTIERANAAIKERM